MRYVVDYSAPPALDQFRPADRAELLEIRAELAACEIDPMDCVDFEATLDALQYDIKACDLALAYPRAYVARDDDGWFFAVDWWEATSRRHGVAGVCRERLSAAERYLDAPLQFARDTMPAWIALHVVGPWTDGRGGWAGRGPNGEFTLDDCLEMAELSAAYYRNGIE